MIPFEDGNKVLKMPTGSLITERSFESISVMVIGTWHSGDSQAEPIISGCR